MKYKGVVIIVFVLVAVFCREAPAAGSHTERYIRVAIIQDAVSLRIKINGAYQVKDTGGSNNFIRGIDLNTTATVSKKGVSLGVEEFVSGRLLVIPDQPDAIMINGRFFRGNIALIKKPNQRLLVVNHVDLEDYIKGILYHEVSHYWPKEVLKAQAIVCRSYALYQAQENKSGDFDLTSDIYSQVYGGRTSERYRTSRMVEETRGKVLFYNNKILPAYFHATCAGHTEDVSRLWNMRLAPLKGVECSFCKKSPHFNWHLVLSFSEIETILAGSAYKIKGMHSIQVVSRDASGRVINLKMVSSKEEIEVSAKDFRNLVGPNRIRSANFTVNTFGKDVVFEGSGWGHGVGLCQWGAYFMAKSGVSYQKILKHYYPGSEIVSIYHE